MPKLRNGSKGVIRTRPLSIACPAFYRWATAIHVTCYKWPLYPRHTGGAVPLRSFYGINPSGTAMIAVVPSFIAVASRKIVKTADLLPPSHLRRGATAELVGEGGGGHSHIPRHVRAPYYWRQRAISGLETVSQGGPQPKHRPPDFDICLYLHK